MRGSSPRVRGRLPLKLRIKARIRLIPASAGQTRSLRLWWMWLTAHPRECGADLLPQHLLRLLKGSSPRVRGRRDCRRRHRARIGLIPASAGQTHHHLSTVGRNTAHPRECGADRGAFSPRISSVGSSPRVRGRRRGCNDHDPAGGLIPASAGQTRTRARSQPGQGAHPRECGADRLVFFVRGYAVGSSPRVRGRLRASMAVRVEIGLIPASAGQTRTAVPSSPAAKAHPRECGADCTCSANRTTRRGSSPRVRGRRG